MGARLLALCLLMLAPLAAPRATRADGVPRERSAQRIYSRAKTTWIWPKPRATTSPLGYVRVGESVRLKSPAKTPGPGCAEGWYAVEPRGYVCAGRTSTLDANDRAVRAVQLLRTRDALLPFSYALSNGSPMYSRLPSREEWLREERWLGEPGTFRPQSWGNRGHERLAEARTVARDSDVPWFLKEGDSAGAASREDLVRRMIPHGSMLAYTRVFEHRGRKFALSSDGTVVPADRVRPYRESKFRGSELGRGVDLPLAFVRQKPRPRWRRTADGDLVAAGEWLPRTLVAISPQSAIVERGGRRYFETRERTSDGITLFIRDDDATLVTRRDGAVFGVRKQEKWLIVSITQGTLVAYEGERPVYTTLISPGAGGVPVAGRDPVKWSTTPLGVFRVGFKHRAADMSPEQGDERSFWLAEVPWTQYFQPPFALHTAYWHEDFGEPMSAGCVNLSPYDGRWLFEWTDPKLPPDWNGVGAGAENGTGTRIVIVR